jgi:hypothetical protein
MGLLLATTIVALVVVVVLVKLAVTVATHLQQQV